MVSADLAKGLQKKRVNQDKWDHCNWLTAVVVSLPNNINLYYSLFQYIFIPFLFFFSLYHMIREANKIKYMKALSHKVPFQDSRRSQDLLNFLCTSEMKSCRRTFDRSRSFHHKTSIPILCCVKFKASALGCSKCIKTCTKRKKNCLLNHVIH